MSRKYTERESGLRPTFGSCVVGALAALALLSGCGPPPAPTAPTTTPPPVPATPSTGLLDQTAVLDALNYWASTVGITYTVLDTDTSPRLLLRAGTDGLGTAVSRGLIDGTSATNQATSGLVVITPSVGSTCSPSQVECREIFRHELGHALGFLDEPALGLMARTPTSDVLSPEEQRMMLALYSLPIGARLQSDGTWRVDATGETGQLLDPVAVNDILVYNVNAAGGASFRVNGLTCRWQLPVPVYFQR